MKLYICTVCGKKFEEHQDASVCPNDEPVIDPTVNEEVEPRKQRTTDTY